MSPSDPVSSDDHGLLYGAGFFETFRTRGGSPARLGAHLARLYAACGRIGIRIPETSVVHPDAADRLRTAIAGALATHGLTDGVVRLTLTAGLPRDGVYPEPAVFLTARALPPGPPAEGIALHLLETRRDTGEWRPRPKSLHYLNSLLASRELAPRRLHPADEGLMTDASGHVCEGVYANLFRIRRGVVFTPHEDTGCLPGIGRAHLIARLRAQGHEVRETREDLATFVASDGIAAVSDVRGVVPVSRWLTAAGDIAGRYDPAAVAPLVLAFGE